MQSCISPLLDSTNDDVAEFNIEHAGLVDYILMYFFSIMFFPITLLASFYTVNPNQEAVVLLFGRLRCTRNEGLHFNSIFGRDVITVSKRIHSLRHQKTDVVDSTGAMLECSATITYQVADPVIAALNFQDVHDYIKNISLAVLKRVVSQYPYISDDPNDSTLMTEGKKVSEEMRQFMQKKSAFAGILTLSFELTEVQYDPIIAPGMLIKQQSQALLSARKLIVRGATEIITSSIDTLRVQGLAFSEDDRTRLVGNLLAVICSDSHVQPTIDVSSGNGKLDELIEVFNNRR
ncbi:hypothetical protein RCL1_001187 [Eukaryota sp. TZLM3-RCL]